jgi:hypothetical protein
MLLREACVEDRLASSAKDEINREEIVRVLARAAGDNGFIARLTESGAEALREYSLTMREKAALLSGDIRWVEAHLGKLNARLRTWLECRLEQEVW